jgi:hypothetical protein
VANSLTKQQAARALYLATSGLWQSATNAPAGMFVGSTQSNIINQSDLDNLKQGLTMVYMVAKRGGRNNAQLEGYIPTQSLANIVYAAFKSAGYGQTVTLAAFNAQYSAMANAYTNAGHLADNMALLSTALAFAPVALAPAASTATQAELAGTQINLGASGAQAATVASNADTFAQLGSASVDLSNSAQVISDAQALSIASTALPSIPVATDFGTTGGVSNLAGGSSPTDILSQQAGVPLPDNFAATGGVSASAMPSIPVSSGGVLDAAGNAVNTGLKTLGAGASTVGAVNTIENALGINKPTTPTKPAASVQQSGQVASVAPAQNGWLIFLIGAASLIF